MSPTPNPPVLPAPPFRLALGLTAPQVVELAGSTVLDEHLDGTLLCFALLGVDRLDGLPGISGPDPFVVISHVHRRIPGAALVGAASATTEHPYNLARKTLSADHLLRGRGGVALGARDRYSAREPDAQAAEITDDALRVLPRVWQTWHPDAIVADVEHRVFADTTRIRRADHHGYFSVDGPGNLPPSRQGTPVLMLHAGDRPGSAPVDVLLGPPRPDLPPRLDGGPGPALRLALGTEDPDADGVVLTFPGLALAEVARELSALPGHAAFDPGATTLRDRLGLAHPPDLLAGAPAAFAA